MMYRSRNSRGRFVGIAGLAFVATLALPPGAAADDQMEVAKRDLGLGLVTLVANVFYVPAKVGYAALGATTGTLAFMLTGANHEAAERIWIPSVGGDYILTSDMVSGRQEIHF
ncbi:MAG: hypothetical protein ACE5D3_05760, partial [Candidatus Binatia bacterium]